MNFSTTISLRMPAQSSGLNTVRLQVILNRRVLLIPLKFSWPEALFDKEGAKCVTTRPASVRPPDYKEALRNAEAALGGDLAQKASDNNLLIGKALGHANEIAIRFRLSDRHLTADEFLREYNSGASQADFLAFMENRIRDRYRRGQIIHNTWKGHTSTLNKLREFAEYTDKMRLAGAAATLPFNAFTHKFAGDFDAWMKKQHLSCMNTRSGRHRNVKAYLELARRDKITFEDPYEYFVNSTVSGQWKPLTPAELLLLEQHYVVLAPGATHRRILQKFLFSCHCGLRLGDLKATHLAKITGQQMELRPHKTYRYDEKDMLLPITKKALSYLNDSRTENECEGFRLYSDQYTNRQLKVMAVKLGIQTNLHHHIGRETYATNFIRRGGKVEVLQKLMGHKKLSMTMKYVHVDEAMKQAEIDRMDELDEQE